MTSRVTSGVVAHSVTIFYTVRSKWLPYKKVRNKILFSELLGLQGTSPNLRRSSAESEYPSSVLTSGYLTKKKRAKRHMGVALLVSPYGDHRKQYRPTYEPLD